MACPERQLSLTVRLWIIITPLMIAVTIITHPRPPTKAASHGGPAPGDSKGVFASKTKQQTAALVIIMVTPSPGELLTNSGHHRWSRLLRSSQPSAEEELLAEGLRSSGAPQSFSKEKPLLGVLYCWKVAAPSCVIRLRCFKGHNRVSSQPNTNSGGNFCANFTTSK